MAMRLMLVISYLHPDACKFPNLQPSSKTVRSANHQFTVPQRETTTQPFPDLKARWKSS
jgi:hypothetical protein